MASFTDLEREWLDRQRRDYQRLQRAALTKVYTQRTGLVPDSFAVVEAHFAHGFGGGRTVDPSRYLTEAECMRILSAGSTATGAP